MTRTGYLYSAQELCMHRDHDATSCNLMMQVTASAGAISESLLCFKPNFGLNYIWSRDGTMRKSHIVTTKTVCSYNCKISDGRGKSHTDF